MKTNSIRLKQADSLRCYDLVWRKFIAVHFNFGVKYYLIASFSDIFFFLQSILNGMQSILNRFSFDGKQKWVIKITSFGFWTLLLLFEKIFTIFNKQSMCAKAVWYGFAWNYCGLWPLSVALGLLCVWNVRVKCETFAYQ